MVRLTTEIWVQALCRRVLSSGEFAAVVKRGAKEAGAIHIIHHPRSGLDSLYGPVPQMFAPEPDGDSRIFEQTMSLENGSQISEKLSRETTFDPDCWIVELEVRNVGDYVTVVTLD